MFILQKQLHMCKKTYLQIPSMILSGMSLYEIPQLYSKHNNYPHSRVADRVCGYIAYMHTSLNLY